MRRSPFTIGLAVLVVGGAVMVAGITRWNPFHHGYRIHAVFSSALSNGIHTGAPVRIAGVNVGTVVDVKRAARGLADVTLEIRDAGRPIHADATVKARPRILLEGNFFLDLRPGTPRAGDMKAGATIPVTRTAVPVQFDQVLDTFTSDIRAANRQALKGFADAVRRGGAGALRDSYRTLPGALRESAVALEAARGSGDRDLARFIRDQGRLSATVDAHRSALVSLLAGYRTTLDAFAARRADLTALVPAFDRLTAEAPPALRNVDAALPDVRRFAVAVRPGLKVAPGVLDDAIPFTRAFGDLLGRDRLPALVDDLRPVTGRLRELEGSLPELLRLVRRVSQCTSDNVLPVLNTNVDDGALSTHQPVWQDLIHGAQGLLSSQQNFGGDGYSTRFSFGLDKTVVATRTGVADLVQLGDEPIVGARPRWTPGHQPPYKPDVPCETQPVQSTAAPAAPAPKPFATVRLQPAGSWTHDELVGHLRSTLRRAAKAK